MEEGHGCPSSGSPVTDLIQALEACDRDAEGRLTQQPAWPFENAIDPSNAAVQIDRDGTPVVYLG